MKKLLPAIAASSAILFAGLPFTASAETAVTDPVGVTTVTVRGKTTTTNPNTYISVNMARPTAYAGVVGTKSVDGGGRSVITFSGSPFTASQFNGTGNAHYLLVDSGTNRGVISEVYATATNSLTLVDDINDVVEDGVTAFKVIPYWTLGTAFPAGAGLNGGTSATLADSVVIIPPTGVSLSYYYNTANSRWQRGSTDSNNVVIPPYSGLLVTRKQAGDVNIKFAGAVFTAPLESIVGAGTTTASKNTLIANPYPVSSVTLANSGLYTASATTGIVGGTSATLADSVVILDASGSAFSYYYNTTNSRWQRGSTDSSNVVIPAGAAVLITRKANRGEFSWFIPQPSMTLN